MNKFHWLKKTDGEWAVVEFVSDTDYYCGSAGTCVGSRLCTDSSEKALYIGETFQAEYKEFFLISK